MTEPTNAPRAHLLLWGFAGLICVVIGLIVGIGTWRAYQMALADATAAAETVAQSAETLTARLLISIDALIVGASADLRQTDFQNPAERDRAIAVLAKANDQSLAVRSLLLANATGEPLLSAGVRVAPDLRPALQELAMRLSSPASDATVVSTPTRSRQSGRWRVWVGRWIETVRGRMILAAEVQIEEFADFYALLASRHGGRIALLRRDGVLLASDPHREDLIARPLANPVQDLAGSGSARSGILANSRGLDGEPEQITAWRRVAGRSLVIVVWIDRQNALAAWQSDLIAAVVTAMVSFALVALFAVALSRTLTRQARIAAELHRSERATAEKSALIEATFAQMGEGLSVFDAENRLVTWNQRYVTLLDLPEEFCCPGLSYADVLAFQAQRGELGNLHAPEDEVSRRLERLVAAPFLIEERETPSGRMLQINRSPLSTGGFVALYTDVSDRRRFELDLARAKAEADRVSANQNDFIQRLSHAVRTPLTSLIGYAELLRETMPAVGADGGFTPTGVLLVAGRQIVRLFDDVVEFSALESGQSQLQIEPVDLSAQLIELVARSARDLHLLGIELDLCPEVGTELEAGGAVLALADPFAVVLTLDSALALVCRHARPGSRIALALRPRPNGIEVRIDGIGDATSRQIASVPDLGHDLLRAIMERQGGAALVRVTPGVGAEIRLLLPACSPPPATSAPR